MDIDSNDFIMDIDTQVNNECTICLSEGLSDESVYTTDCNHVFCKECLSLWFERGKQDCPLCRNIIRNYTSMDMAYRIIVQQSNVNSADQVTRESIRNARSYSELMITLMRYRLFSGVLFILFILLANYYFALMVRYEEISVDYNLCINQTESLTDELEICNDEDETVYVTIYDGHQLRHCLYPQRFLQKCLSE